MSDGGSGGGWWGGYGGGGRHNRLVRSLLFDGRYRWLQGCVVAGEVTVGIGFLDGR